MRISGGRVFELDNGFVSRDVYFDGEVIAVQITKFMTLPVAM